MPQLPSSRKALRQSLKRRDRNRAKKKQMKLAARAVVDAAKAGNADDMAAAVVLAQKSLDKAAKTNVIHKKTAARRKSRLMKRAQALLATAQPK
jgi:small subunit ribosomal protein S20